jgi:hypothetical protein
MLLVLLFDCLALYKQSPSNLPDPTELLGGLNGNMKDWPEQGTPDRERYLRETKAHEELIFHFTKSVVTTPCFNANSASLPLSDYLYTSLEAFLVVTYVNGYWKWLLDLENKQGKSSSGDEADKENDEENGVSDITPESASTKRFTNMSRGKGKYKGWAEEGMDLYNKIFDILKEQRKDNVAGFDKKLKERFEKECNGGTGVCNRPAKRSRSDEEEYIAKINAAKEKNQNVVQVPVVPL